VHRFYAARQPGRSLIFTRLRHPVITRLGEAAPSPCWHTVGSEGWNKANQALPWL